MKPPPTPFDLAGAPLEAGTTLLEASAGTGKTFTIAGLFLRLLLEAELPVNEILVVTFTEAATEELRDRIRRLLVDAARAFATGRSELPLLETLVARHRTESAAMRERLERALAGFDEAPIFTIHGFCQRMLRDRAFESGVLFDTELVTDQSELLQELADDWWRARFYSAARLRLLYALRAGLGPEALLKLLRSTVSHPGLRLVSSVDGRGLESLGTALERAFGEARAAWCAGRTGIEACFGSAAKWANKPYNRDAEMAENFALLARAFSDEATPAVLKVFELFTNSALEESTHAKHQGQTPKHRFFDLCDALLERVAEFHVGLQLDFLTFATRELPLRKLRQKAQSFDDLLTRLRDALAAAGGEALAAAIRARFPAALIDEFQDTDPVQYEIFRRVFADGASRLFLIGDPKQAIYGFRGADIFTYLHAAANADREFTLGENWRSESGLVHAVNRVFSRVPEPFVFDRIRFQPVLAKGRADRTPFTIAGAAEPPLQLWFWPRAGDKLTKGRARKELPAAVAAEIARLLAGRARIGATPVRPGNIAVLVETHNQAQRVQDALTALRVPSVQHATASLFATHEARELTRVLAAVARPGDERLVRGALATDLLGVSANDLAALALDEGGWQRHLEHFRELLGVWTSRSFIQMFRRWLVPARVRQRLLHFPDGERRLTNVLHLAEVLHQAAVELRLGPAALVKWLAEQQARGVQAAEEHQLRLESDDAAVRIVTIHKSKGLEYDVVFCPFAWRHSKLTRGNQNQAEQVIFHDAAADERLTRDLGPAHLPERRQAAIRECLAENVRLLYVALTRARHRCYFVWGAIADANTSAAAWLLHGPPPVAPDLLVTMEAHLKAKDDEQLRADLRQLADDSSENGGVPAIAVSDLPTDEAEPYQPVREAAPVLQSRAFAGQVRRDWRIESFSSLTANAPAELPDHDGAARPSAPAELKAEGIFAFPRGTQPGTCLHKIFEELDFTQRDETALAALVNQQLTEHGLDAAQFTPAVCDAVRRTLAVPLELGRDEFTLAGVTPARRLNELEFGFPLRTLSAAALADCFARHGEAALLGEFIARLRRLTFAEVRGHLKGFIDLVFERDGRFYLADWKSNHLGNRAEDYGSDALRAAMTEHHYWLQYHLYTVALHRYLGLRVPGYDYEQHFGGVCYFFVRGVDPARPELGVFRNRPSAELIRALDELLVETEVKR